ncbi:protein kinase domain-containing protein [Nonomuraea sp. KM88]|uniref:protein kinase domain-containing protein n=1 Tax=Nonomuraea sp. KM88 TaxID=3457427 RepID=UPI003FCD6698
MMQRGDSVDPRILYKMAPKTLGRGGYAEVRGAIRREDGLRVALKRCNSTPDALARLYREINAQRDLAHPNIMPVWDFDPGYQWYTMPQAEGTLTARRSQLSEDDFASLLVDVSRALDVAHNQEHIHRDLSPNNILLISVPESQSPRWVISDWGLVLRPPTSSSPPLTVTGQGVGTPGFSAPELMVDAKYQSSKKVDIYSIGRLAEWFLSGKWPVHGIYHLPDGKNQHWRQFIRACAAPQPEDRPASLSDVRTLLQQVFESKDQPPSDRARTLLAGILSGSREDLSALVTFALGHTDDADIYLDSLALVPSAKLHNWTVSEPRQASILAQQMAWHIVNSWGDRDSSYVDAPLGCVHAILQTLVEGNELGHAEDVALQYFLADMHTQSGRQRDRTLEWLADLDGAAARVMHRVLTPRRDLVTYYKQARTWQPRSDLLSALLVQ